MDETWYVHAIGLPRDKGISVVIECDELFPHNGSYPSESTIQKFTSAIDRRLQVEEEITMDFVLLPRTRK